MKNLVFFLFLIFSSLLFGDQDQSFSESFENKSKIWNQELSNLRDELKKNHDHLYSKYSQGAPDSEIQALFSEIQKIKKQILSIHEIWKSEYGKAEKNGESHYSFWDQGETTLSQLVMEFGAIDYLYVMPHELSTMKIHLFSGIPIPHDSWEEMIQLILSHYGIGVKKVNHFMRELFLIKHNPSQVDAIIQSPEELALLPSQAIVFYVFSPPSDQSKIAQSFFERFADLSQTTIQLIGSKVILISTKEAIERLLNVYNVVLKESEEKTIRTIHLVKTTPKEAIGVLDSYFSELSSKSRPSVYNLCREELVFLPYQDNGIVLIGKKSLVAQAEEILEKLEEQNVDPEEMTFSWYTCKYSDPEEIAKTLDQLYSSLSHVNLDSTMIDKPIKQNLQPEKQELAPVSLQAVKPAKSERKDFSKKSSENFVVDAKTNSILMVIKRKDLEKIQTLLKKLDVPKKMVRLDVLLVERKSHDQKQTGINLLKLGTSDVKKDNLGMNFSSIASGKGILDFILTRKESKSFPSFDLTLGFLLAQNNLQISANPSVTAINQTEASISIVEEISINNGAVAVEGSKSYKESFVRAQYGIKICMTPIIHQVEEGASGFVTLQTKINFDTPTQTTDSDHPPVTRRELINEVRVADGETIILGGLLRKSSEEDRERLPFLGEIPGIGKIFGTTRLDDNSTEMFIFITPHIICESELETNKQSKENLKQRPGDFPLVNEKILEGKREGKKKIFEQSMQLFLDSSK